MIGTLIESQAHAQRHHLGSAISALAHGTLFAAAVVATAGRNAGPITVPPVETYLVVPPVPPSPAQRDQRPTSETRASVVAVPFLPAIDVPTMIPTEIPPIDFTSNPTALDFNERRSHGGEPCTDPCVRLGASGDTASSVWGMNEAIMQLREPPVPPRYPEALRRAGIDGTVVVRFIVDTLGRVDRASIEVLSSSHDLFAAAVRETLFRLRFNPAMVGNRKVRAAAMMPFHFTLK